MNLRVVLAIFQKDFLEGLKNHQVLLMLATPVVLSLIFSNLYSDTKAKTLLPKVGIIGNDHPLLSRFSQENFGVRLAFFKTRKELEARILEGEVAFGMIITGLLDINQMRQGKISRLILLYPNGIPDYTAERMQYTLDREIRQFLDVPAATSPVDIQMVPIGDLKEKESAFGNDFFPMWILMTLGMVGFLGVPISFV
ncbi:hypothetical protein HYY75_08645, partial [bacterium]|nr:hypothetical protein [bacterium]